MKFEMTDAGGSYDWILEGSDPEDAHKMLDHEIYDNIDNHISIARESLLAQIEATAEVKSYPCFGYTTAQVFENEAEYVAFKTEEMDETLAQEREHLFKHIKAWQAENSQNFPGEITGKNYR